MSARTMVVVSAVGEAAGALGHAAAIACGLSDGMRAALLLDIGAATEKVRPSLVSTGPARDLERRLRAMPATAGAVARGRICRLALAGAGPLAALPPALAAAPEAPAVVHVRPELLQEALDLPPIRPEHVILRGDLERDMHLIALTVRDLLGRRGFGVGLVKSPLGRTRERLALAGVLDPDGPGPRRC